MSTSQVLSCGHCGNTSKMDIVGSVSDMEPNVVEVGLSYDEGFVYSVLKCPACRKSNIVSYYWAEYMDPEDEVTYELIYPENSNYPVGLPDKILVAFKAAEKVKSIDVNAYAILLRRLLEIVCLDRKASGNNLALMLKDLAAKKEIPDKLVKVALGLKDFGNIGAHAGSGELTEEEIPIVNALCIAILEYVYSAPHLADLAEAKLNSIKNKAKVPKVK